MIIYLLLIVLEKRSIFIPLLAKKLVKEVAFSAFTFSIPNGLCTDEIGDIFIIDSSNQIFKANSQLNISVVYKDVFAYPGGIEYNEEKKALYAVDDPDSGEAIYIFMGNGNSSKFCAVDGVTCLAVDGSNTLAFPSLLIDMI